MVGPGTISQPYSTVDRLWVDEWFHWFGLKYTYNGGTDGSEYIGNVTLKETQALTLAHSDKYKHKITYSTT